MLRGEPKARNRPTRVTTFYGQSPWHILDFSKVSVLLPYIYQSRPVETSVSVAEYRTRTCGPKHLARSKGSLTEVPQSWRWQSWPPSIQRSRIRSAQLLNKCRYIYPYGSHSSINQAALHPMENARPCRGSSIGRACGSYEETTSRSRVRAPPSAIPKQLVR